MAFVFDPTVMKYVCPKCGGTQHEVESQGCLPNGVKKPSVIRCTGCGHKEEKK